MTRIKLILFALVVASLSLVFVACGDDEEDGGGGGGGESLDLVVGSLVPQTGGRAPFAPAGEKAIGLAMDEINAAMREYAEYKGIRPRPAPEPEPPPEPEAPSDPPGDGPGEPAEGAAPA